MCLLSDKGLLLPPLQVVSWNARIFCFWGDRSPPVYEAKMIQTDSNYSVFSGVTTVSVFVTFNILRYSLPS